MAANNTIEDYETFRRVSLSYFIIIGVLGIISNMLVIIVFIKHDKLRTAANLFIVNLAICDLIIAVNDIIFSIPSLFNGRWMFNRAACVFYGLMHYFFISVTVSTLAAISIDRFFYITKPAQVKTWRITRGLALGMLSVIYVYVLLFTFPPLTGWNSFVTEEYFYSGCYINYSDQDPAAISYSVIASMFLFLAPLIVMVVSYQKIYTAVRTSTRKTISRGPGPPGTPGTLRKKYPLFKRTHVQTAKMIVVVIFFCIIVWLPYVVVSLIKAFTGTRVVSPLSSHITILITKSCVVYNVLIYVFLNRKLKSAIILLICCGKVPQWLTKDDKTSTSRVRISRIVGDTDKDVPSDVTRKRLGAIVEQGNDSANSSDGVTPVMDHKKGNNNHLSQLSNSSTPSILYNMKTVESMGNNHPLEVNCQVTAFENQALDVANSELQENQDHKSSTLNASSNQVLSNSIDSGILSFNSLQTENHLNQIGKRHSLVNSRPNDVISIDVTTKDSKNEVITDNSKTNVNRYEPKNDVTRIEARRRALRKMNQKESSNRKLPTLPPTTKGSPTHNTNNKLLQVDASFGSLHIRESSSSTAIPSSNTSLSESSINSNTNSTTWSPKHDLNLMHNKQSAQNEIPTNHGGKTHSVLSRQNSSSTAIPSSNYSSMSETSVNVKVTSPKADLITRHSARSKKPSVKPVSQYSQENPSSTVAQNSNHRLSDVSLNTTFKDDSSVNTTPRTAAMAYSTPRNLRRKSKTIGYRGGRSQALLRDKLRHSSKDPLHVSPSELHEIRTYWKRMSLCLDDIDIDEEV